MVHLKGDERARYISEMFDRISSRYDLLNTLMTGGRHHKWRDMAACMVPLTLTGPALDVATGTGDLALKLALNPRVTNVIGVDFSREMLHIAKRKTLNEGLNSRLDYVQGDAHDLPFPDNHFICASAAFGIRNFADLPQALSEMARVVKPGGRVISLEIVPRNTKGPIGHLARLYFKYVTPWLGTLIAGDREAYTYLPESVKDFADVDELTSTMKYAGLSNIIHRKVAFGTVAIHTGEVIPRGGT